MQIYKRQINKNEIFCCSLKDAKELFRDTEVNLQFAYPLRDYEYFYQYMSFLKKHVKGKVIASMEMAAHQTDPSLSFYVLNEKEFSEELKKEFKSNVLPKFYQFYLSKLYDSAIHMPTLYHMLAEILGNKINIYYTTR